jgi:hypothetical protein
MGIKKKKKRVKGKIFTQEDLAALIRIWLDKHEADMAADYRPEEPLWRKLLADRLAEDIYKARGVKYHGQ